MKVLGWILLVPAGLYTLYLNLAALYLFWDILGLVIGISIGPATLIAMPFYLLFKFNDWTLMISTCIAIVGWFILGREAEIEEKAKEKI